MWKPLAVIQPSFRPRYTCHARCTPRRIGPWSATPFTSIPWTKYLALPAEITPFEQRFLAHLNKVALVFFYLHIPVLMAVAWAAGTGPLYVLALSLVVMTGPTIAYRTIPNPPPTTPGKSGKR